MLTAYIKAAMRKARYEILSDDHTFYGEVPGLDGVWAKPALWRAAATTSKKLWKNGLRYACQKVSQTRCPASDAHPSPSRHQPRGMGATVTLSCYRA